ncbi:MAG: Lrp/AsnC family transcriptional regulator [Rhodovibrionaceae bacterium]|nr:Lrp/AsnC family transcriptional regulator [Rhodovibrionaceae bacterium]
MPRDAKLDRIDLKIVATLQDSARITNQSLADAVGLSASPCLTRVRRLEDAHVIGPYRADVNLDKICRTVTVFATVSLKSHDQEDFRTFEANVKAIPEVVQAFKVSGDFDYLLRFVCADIARYHQLSDELLLRGGGMVRLTSHVVLDETKSFTGYPLASLVEV